MILRHYQTAIIEATRTALRVQRSCLIVSPTGSGKTALTASMLGGAAQRGRRSWFLVHRKELVEQTSRTFQDAGIRHGVVAAGYEPRPGELVQVCMVQSLAKRMKTLARPHFLVTDECHHTPAATYARIIAEHSDAYHVGLTATPERLDGAGLRPWFASMVQGPSTAWLIQHGYLSPYRLFAPSVPDLRGVRTQAGDYSPGELSSAMDTPSITGDVVAHYQRLAAGKRAIVFCASVEHAYHVALSFQHKMIEAGCVHGGSLAIHREQTMRAFAAGKIRVLCNVDLFAEGLDVPGIECVILLRPTQSLGLYLQQVGRGLRPIDGKTCVILDHAGNALRHGLPDDEREWSLDGTKRTKRGAAEPSCRQCPACYRVARSHVRQCECGHVWVIESRSVDEVAGELEEINAAHVRQRRRFEQASARTLEDLIALGQRRGYKNPAFWARTVFSNRAKRA